MGTLLSKKSKKKQIRNKTKKVVHTYRVLTGEDIRKNRSNAYTFIL